MPDRIPTHKPPRANLSDQRPSSSARGYDARWRRFRLWWLRQHPLCMADGCDQAASHVDHITPMERGGAQYDEANLQSLCASCHSRKTATTDGGFGRKG